MMMVVWSATAPFMDEPAEFTGEYVVSLDRAWSVVQDFARTGKTGDHDDWHELREGRRRAGDWRA